MRVAAIYDVHGNLPALDAVLEAVRRDRVDRIVFGGDALPGPMPRETLARLRALDVPAEFIHGNGDRETVAWRHGQESAVIPAGFRDTMRWVAQQLTDEDERQIAAWPATLSLAVPGHGDVLFCHASPRNDTDIFTRVTPDERLAPLFHDVRAHVVVCGHTHMPFDRTHAGVRIVNAGSVGMPFGVPGAHWLLIQEGRIEFRRTDYDLAAAADAVRRTAYPQAEHFASQSILQPPAEAAMLEAFSR